MSVRGRRTMSWFGGGTDEAVCEKCDWGRGTVTSVVTEEDFPRARASATGAATRAPSRPRSQLEPDLFSPPSLFLHHPPQHAALVPACILSCSLHRLRLHCSRRPFRLFARDGPRHPFNELANLPSLQSLRSQLWHGATLSAVITETPLERHPQDGYHLPPEHRLPWWNIVACFADA